MQVCLALVQQQVYAHMVLLEAAWFYLIQYMRQEGSTGYRMHVSLDTGCFYWIQDASAGNKILPQDTECFYYIQDASTGYRMILLDTR